MKKLFVTALLATALFGCKKESSEFCECVIRHDEVLGNSNGLFVEVGQTPVLLLSKNGDCSVHEGYSNFSIHPGYAGQVGNTIGDKRDYTSCK